MTTSTDFAGNSTAAYEVPPPGETVFERLPAPLRGMQTHAVFIGPNNTLFKLAGPGKGDQGVRFCTQLDGPEAWPTEQVMTNSPYVMGATIQRTNVGERMFHAGIIIGNHAPPMTEYQYRMAASHWWESQDENNDGWLGLYTRFSGWRWIPVRPFQTINTPQRIDPTAYGNNASQWDIQWVAQRPYFTRVALYESFQASLAGLPTLPPSGFTSGTPDPLLSGLFYWGTITLANRGDLPSYAQYYVTSPGQAILQDNQSQRLVVMPSTTADVGTYMCDTAPAVRTLTAANDPKDNLLYDLIRQSVVLDFFLGAIANEGLPLALQFQNRFIYTIPPQTVVQLTVGHSNPAAVITAMVPQKYKRAG